MSKKWEAVQKSYWRAFCVEGMIGDLIMAIHL